MNPQNSNEDILKLLDDDARRIRVARKLPDGTLDTDLSLQVVDDFFAYLEERQISLAQVAHELGKGFSAPTLSQLKYAREGKFVGDLERIVRGVNSWMEQHEMRREAQMPREFVPVHIAKRMLTVILNTVRLQTMSTIYGPSGVGKTITLQAAHAKYPGSILLRVRRSTRTASGMARAIGAALKIERAKNLFDLQSQMILRLQGSGRLLLIDEAHQLQADAMELLRDLHDETEIPIVLCGTKDLHTKVSDVGQWYGQLTSRFGLRYDIRDDLNHSSRGRGKPQVVATVDELLAIFAKEEIRFTGDGLKYLEKLANVDGLGGLRLVRQIVRVAVQAAKAKAMNEPLSRAFLHAVFAEMQSHETVGIRERDADSGSAADVAVA